MIRFDIPYVDTDRTLTQAGYEVLKGQERRIDTAETNIVALEAVAITAAPGTAPKYACRAWVNFNGTGTVAIRAAGNVSSITDNGVGLYTVNFTTAMPDTDYSVAVNAGGVAAVYGNLRTVPALAAGSVGISILTPDPPTNVDASHITVAVFR